MKYAYWDIETLDFFQDPHIKSLPRSEQLQAIRFGIGVVLWPGGMINYGQAECALLYENLCWAGCKLVGWNTVGFDWPIVLASSARRGVTLLEIEHATVEHVDLFAAIRQATGRWYKLDVVAAANLDRQKLGHGLQATEWLRSGDPEQIRKAFEYCQADVQLVADLHAILLSGQPLSLPPRPERGELNEIRIWGDGRTE
jgi:RNase_H superfamily